MPNADLLPRWDWYDLDCRQEGRRISFRLCVRTDHLQFADGTDRDQGVGLPFDFGSVDLDLVEDGTVGLVHEGNGEVYIHDWCLAGKGKVCKQ